MALFSVFVQLPAERPALDVFLCVFLLGVFLRYLFHPFLCHHMNPHFPIGTGLIVTTGFPRKQENSRLSWYSSLNKTHTLTSLVYAKLLERIFLFNALFQQLIYSHSYISYSVDNIYAYPYGSKFKIYKKIYNRKYPFLPLLLSSTYFISQGKDKSAFQKYFVPERANICKFVCMWVCVSICLYILSFQT